MRGKYHITMRIQSFNDLIDTIEKYDKFLDLHILSLVFYKKIIQNR